VPSPFPGVDPYLEAQHCWRDFHQQFIHDWRERLLAELPPRYDARLQEDVYIGRLSPEETRRLIVPDIAAVAPRKSRPAADGGGVAVREQRTLAPSIIPHVVIEERRQSSIEIRERPRDRLVAVLEVLSPTNKGSGRAKYLKKRRDLRRARVHLVEVDLLIGGQSPPLAMPLPETHFHVLLTRVENPRQCEVYSWDLPEPLPTIPIPLLSPDPDLPANLQAVFDLAFDRGQYPRVIDYALPLELAVDDATRKWASEIGAAFASPPQ
jgi:hypothetical protein